MYFLLFALLVKHQIADLILQGRLKKIPGNKAQFTQKRLQVHGLDHSIGTLIVFSIAVIWLTLTGNDTKWYYIIVPFCFAIGDHLLHCVIDMMKNKYVTKHNYHHGMREFWVVSGIDQICHISCYVFYVWLFDKYIF